MPSASKTLGQPARCGATSINRCLQQIGRLADLRRQCRQRDRKQPLPQQKIAVGAIDLRIAENNLQIGEYPRAQVHSAYTSCSASGLYPDACCVKSSITTGQQCPARRSAPIARKAVATATRQTDPLLHFPMSAAPAAPTANRRAPPRSGSPHGRAVQKAPPQAGPPARVSAGLRPPPTCSAAPPPGRSFRSARRPRKHATS